MLQANLLVMLMLQQKLIGKLCSNEYGMYVEHLEEARYLSPWVAGMERAGIFVDQTNTEGVLRVMLCTLMILHC